jgi:hypothetical protein
MCCREIIRLRNLHLRVFYIADSFTHPRRFRYVVVIYLAYRLCYALVKEPHGLWCFHTC